MEPGDKATDLLSLYEKYGDADYIGEPVSQTEHMSQCAQLAMASGAGDEMILAAFFHDIGHFCEHLMPVGQMDGFGVADQETLGANYLRQLGFSETIARLVASHVPAKRYLTFADAEYDAQLSDASRETLRHQGGPMPPHEAAAFEADPLFSQYIQLRRWDEQAKEPGIPVISFQLIREKILNHFK